MMYLFTKVGQKDKLAKFFYAVKNTIPPDTAFEVTGEEPVREDGTKRIVSTRIAVNPEDVANFIYKHIPKNWTVTITFWLKTPEALDELSGVAYYNKKQARKVNEKRTEEKQVKTKEDSPMDALNLLIEKHGKERVKEILKNNGIVLKKGSSSEDITNAVMLLNKELGKVEDNKEEELF